MQGQFDTNADISSSDKYNFSFLSVSDPVTIVSKLIKHFRTSYIIYLLYSRYFST